MDLPASLGRTQIAIAVAVLAVMGLMAVPFTTSCGKKNHLADIQRDAEDLRQAELRHKEAFSEYVAAEDAPRSQMAVNEAPVNWVGTSGFDKLSWAPGNSAEVWASYRVVRTQQGFTVTAKCDLDGDGRTAVFTATESQPAKLETPNGVY